MGRAMRRSKRVGIFSAGAVVVLFAAAVGIWRWSVYAQHQQTVAEYQKWMAAAIQDIHSNQLGNALKDVRKAAQYEKTGVILTMERVLEKTERRGLKLSAGTSPAEPLTVDGGKVVQGKYDIVQLAASANNFQKFGNNIMNTLDFQAFVDREPIGATVYALVILPNGAQRTVKTTVVPLPSGSIGFTGQYTNQRYGVSVNLPTLVTGAISYGWIPSFRPTDGDGRTFTDPLNPHITVVAYGSNNVMSQSPGVSIPPSAHILRNVQIGNYPAIIYTNVQSAQNISVFSESIVAGASNLQSSNEVDVAVPQLLLPQWQPIVSTIIDSFKPGDLSQAY